MSTIFKLVDKKIKRVVAEFDNLTDASEKQAELNKRLKEKGISYRYVVITDIA